MRQVIINFPIDILPSGVLPEKLLTVTPSVRFLRLDIEGFLFTFRLGEDKIKETVDFLRKHYKAVQKGSVTITHEGQGILLVSGKWIQDGKFAWNDYKGYLSKGSEFSKWMNLYQTKTYLLRSPEACGTNIRFTFACDSEILKLVTETLKGLNIPFRVETVTSFRKNADSAFDRLTLQQARIFRLAYAEGYYSVPRKISTEQLANLLKMEKGNVGEHLRRAEKNIMDFLMIS